MIKNIFKSVIGILKTKPTLLWGLTLLYAVIGTVITTLGAGVPIVVIPVLGVLEVGMAHILLTAYNGGTVKTEQLFEGFKKDRVLKIAGGMSWEYLWEIIWLFVPVMNVIKAYEYRFTKYILLENEDVSALDALKVSMKQTYGYKGLMFLADVIICLAVIVEMLVFTALMFIPYIGILFGVISFFVQLGVILLLPMVVGLVEAAFYQESKNGTKNVDVNHTPVAIDEPDWECAECHTINAGGTKYCRACGREKE